MTKTTVVKRTVADPALKRAVAALTARVAATDRARATLQKTVEGLGARVSALATKLDNLRPAGAAQLQAQLHALSTQLRTANQCLFQVQKQLDDLQAFGLTKSALHKRVSGACLGILQPRYAGQ